MKRLNFATMAGVLVCVLGCVSAPPVTVVGPADPTPADRGTTLATGGLRVYSATEEHVEGEYSYYYPHTDYLVCDAAGKIIRNVHNHVGNMDEAPAWVSLPAGSYQVRARDERLGELTIPVVVKPGQTTVVHLDDRWTPPAKRAGQKLVRLPDGEAIGWRASAQATAGNGSRVP
jgi:hypothetical protein